MRNRLFLFLLSFHFTLYAQELPRRVFLGIRMENITEDTRHIMELKEKGGVLISEVIPHSTAESAGFKKGDILLAVNGAAVASTNEVLSALAGKKEGETLTYELVRNRKKVNGKATFRSFPRESYNDLEVEYTSVNSVNGQQRVILTKRKHSGKFPAVVFIGGIGCYSLDNAMDTNRSESKLLTMLSREGFLCARPEKPGMGDNAKFSKPCATVGFNEELDGYVQTVNALKQRSDVDSTSIYIIGHSMGGVFAPLVARQTSVKGVIAYGTIGSNFQEYLIKSRRTIAEAYGLEPAETDNMIKDNCECAHYYFVDKMSSAEVIKKKPDCRDYVSIFDLRSRAYNDELFALNIPEAWKAYHGKALLVWGESDYISVRDDHQIIVNAINFYHPGHAQLLTIPNAEHGMNTAANFSIARTSPGRYNEEVGKQMLGWLKGVL